MLNRLFLDHPHTVNESYFEHARAALYFSALLFFAAICAFLHALVPAVCERTASRIIHRLAAQMGARGR